MSILFKAFLESIPSSRSEMVTELEIPDDVSISPYIQLDYEEDPAIHQLDDLVPEPVYSPIFDGDDNATVTSDSSLALSRAMTDSDIDYDWFRRLKHRRSSVVSEEIRATMEAFPSEYLTSLNSFIETENTPPSIGTYERSRVFEDELREKMIRFFDEECCVFATDDPGLIALQDALDNIDYSLIDFNIYPSRPY